MEPARRDAAAAPSGRAAPATAGSARSSAARGPVRFTVTDTWRDTIPHKARRRTLRERRASLLT
jgi:hypothetical protein